MNKQLFCLVILSLFFQGISTVNANEGMVRSFKEVTSSGAFANEIKDGLTVVKFSAQWCPPCKKYAPIFKNIAERNPEINVDGRKVAVNYLIIDVDKCQQVAQTYKINSIPATVFFKNGSKVASLTGIQNETAIVRQLQQLAKN